MTTVPYAAFVGSAFRGGPLFSSMVGTQPCPEREQRLAEVYA